MKGDLPEGQYGQKRLADVIGGGLAVQKNRLV
jgi:hypothetical protein